MKNPNEQQGYFAQDFRTTWEHSPESFTKKEKKTMYEVIFGFCFVAFIIIVWVW